MIESIGIVGAGTMGNGIAQVCAAAGLPVVMTDISDASLTRGMSVVASSLERLVNKQKMTDADRQTRIESLLNEHRQRWFYRNWAHALDAPDWRQWRRSRPHVPERM